MQDKVVIETGWMNGGIEVTDECMDGWIDRMNGWMVRMNGWMDE